MTLGSERHLGDRIVREIYRDPDYLEDPVLSDHVQEVWQPLLAAARLRGELTPELEDRFSWRILLVRDRSINAFALPGGYLGLHLGLLGVMTRRAELASVMAHELSHVTQRHIARLISKQNQQAPLILGAMILGVLAAARSPDAANAAVIGTQALAAQMQLSFSRDMEREADRVGYGVALQAGFEAQGFVSMFDKLQQANRINDSGAFPYLRSHPLTTERIADMQSRLELAGRTPEPAPDLVQSLAAARARLLAQPRMDALTAAADEAQGGRLRELPLHRRAALLYAGALASGRLRDFRLAERLLDELRPLLASDPVASRWVRQLAAENAIAAQDLAKARQLTDLQSTQRPELLLAAQARLDSAHAGAVMQRLQAWVIEHPLDAPAWQLLASASTAAASPLRALRAQAEVYAAQMDYAKAADTLHAAQDWVRQGARGGPVEHIEASIIDARSREIGLLAKEQLVEH